VGSEEAVRVRDVLEWWARGWFNWRRSYSV